MMKNLSLVVLGAALGFGTMALTGGGASAAALQPFQPLAQTQQNVANDGMIQLAASNQHRRMRSTGGTGTAMATAVPGAIRPLPPLPSRPLL